MIANHKDCYLKFETRIRNVKVARVHIKDSHCVHYRPYLGLDIHKKHVYELDVSI